MNIFKFCQPEKDESNFTQIKNIFKEENFPQKFETALNYMIGIIFIYDNDNIKTMKRLLEDIKKDKELFQKIKENFVSIIPNKNQEIKYKKYLEYEIDIDNIIYFIRLDKNKNIYQNTKCKLNIEEIRKYVDYFIKENEEELHKINQIPSNKHENNFIQNKQIYTNNNRLFEKKDLNNNQLYINNTYLNKKDNSYLKEYDYSNLNKNQSNLRSNENISNFNNNYISNSKQSIYNNQSNVNNNFPSDSQNNNLNDFKSSSIGLIQDDLITMSKNPNKHENNYIQNNINLNNNNNSNINYYNMINNVNNFNNIHNNNNSNNKSIFNNIDINQSVNKMFQNKNSRYTYFKIPEKLVKEAKERLPEEPEDNNDVTTITFRYPSSKKAFRKFNKDDKIELMFDFVYSLGDDIFNELKQEKFYFSQPFPNKIIEYSDKDETFLDMTLYPDALLDIVPVKANK